MANMTGYLPGVASVVNCDGVYLPTTLSGGNVWEVSSYSHYTTYTDDVTSEPPVLPTPAPTGGATRLPNAARRLALSNSGSLQLAYAYRFPTLAAATEGAASVTQASLQAAASGTARSLPPRAYAPFYTIEERNAIVAVAAPPFALAPVVTPPSGDTGSSSNNNLLYL